MNAAISAGAALTASESNAPRSAPKSATIFW